MTQEFLLVLLIRSTCVLLVSIGFMALLRTRPKASRLVGRLTLAVLAGLLFVPTRFPSAPVAIPHAYEEPIQEARSPAQPPVEDATRERSGIVSSAPLPKNSEQNWTTSGAAPESDPVESKRGPDFPALLPWIWLSGVLAMAGWTLFGCLKLAQLRKGSTPVRLKQVEETARSMGLASPETHLLDAASPFVALAPHPCLFLPRDWETAWPDSARQQILRHELSHLASNDLSYRLMARLIHCFLWPQPLMVILIKQMDSASESLADAVVLDSGAVPIHYAAVLAAAPLDRLKAAPPLAAGIARRSGSLKARIKGILEYQPESTSRRLLAAIGSAALGALVLAGCLTGLKNQEQSGAEKVVQVLDFDGRPLKKGKAWVVLPGIGRAVYQERELPISNGEISLGDKRELSPRSVIFVQRQDGSFDFFQLGRLNLGKTVLTLRPSAVHEMSVTNDDGTAVAGASYAIRTVIPSQLDGSPGTPVRVPEELVISGRTDSEGVSSFTKFPMAGLFQIESGDSLYALSIRTIGQSSDWNRVNLTVRRSVPGQISGVLVERGMRASNVEVWVKTSWPGSIYRASYLSETSEYLATGLPPDDYQVIAQSTIGSASVFLANARVKPGRQTKVPKVDLNPLHDLAGRLVDKKGLPVGNRIVQATSSRGVMNDGMNGRTATSQARTKEDGSFSFRVMEGEVTLLVFWPESRKGSGPEQWSQEASPFGEKVILKPHSSSLNVTVVHRPWNQPRAPGSSLQKVEKAQEPKSRILTVTRHDGSVVQKGRAWVLDAFGGRREARQPKEAFVIKDGILLLPLSVKEGNLFVFQEDGSFDVFHLDKIPAGQDRLVMRKSRDIAVSLTDARGRPSVNTLVKPIMLLSNSNGPMISFHETPKDFPLTQRTSDAAGRIIYRGVPTGTWLQFTSGKPDKAIRWLDRYDSAGNATRSEFRGRVESSGTITGRVTGLTASDGQGHFITIVNELGVNEVGNNSLETGVFSLPELYPGEYLIQAVPLSFKLQPDIKAVVSSVKVLPGQTYKVDLPFKKPIKLSGRALTKDGRPLIATPVGFSLVGRTGQIGFPTLLCQTGSSGEFSLQLSIIGDLTEIAVSLTPPGTTRDSSGNRIVLDEHKSPIKISVVEMVDFTRFPPVFERL